MKKISISENKDHILRLEESIEYKQNHKFVFFQLKKTFSKIYIEEK